MPSRYSSCSRKTNGVERPKNAQPRPGSYPWRMVYCGVPKVNTMEAAGETNAAMTMVATPVMDSVVTPSGSVAVAVSVSTARKDHTES